MLLGLLAGAVLLGLLPGVVLLGLLAGLWLSTGSLALSILQRAGCRPALALIG